MHIQVEGGQVIGWWIAALLEYRLTCLNPVEPAEDQDGGQDTWVIPQRVPHILTQPLSGAIILSEYLCEAVVLQNRVLGPWPRLALVTPHPDKIPLAHKGEEVVDHRSMSPSQSPSQPCSLASRSAFASSGDQPASIRRFS